MSTITGTKQAPTDLGEFIDMTYHEDSGMEYEVYEVEDGEGEVYVSSSHEDVGLVTWYRYPSLASAEISIGL